MTGVPSCSVRPYPAVTNRNAAQMLDQGRNVFRFDTFGDEKFWGDTLMLHKAIEGKKLVKVLYRLEGARGYDAAGELFSPGYFRVDLSGPDPVTLTASTQSWDSINALPPDLWGHRQRQDRPSVRHERARMSRQVGPPSHVSHACGKARLDPGAVMPVVGRERRG